MVAFDHARERAGQRPAAGEHAADERVIDAELSAFTLEAILRGPRVTVHPDRDIPDRHGRARACRCRAAAR